MDTTLKFGINGYILAGGKSTRMGEDKAMMQFKGQPVIKYAIDALQSEVKEVIIVSNNPDYRQFGLKVIADEIKDTGPAGGIYTALNQSDTEMNFMMGCDMPFVTSEAIAFMIKNVGTSQIMLPVHSRQMEPLFGLYKREIVKEWKRLVEEGVLKLHDLVGHFDLMKINMDLNGKFNESLFMNINTREEFNSALEQNEN